MSSPAICFVVRLAVSSRFFVSIDTILGCSWVVFGLLGARLRVGGAFNLCLFPESPADEGFPFSCRSGAASASLRHHLGGRAPKECGVGCFEEIVFPWSVALSCVMFSNIWGSIVFSCCIVGALAICFPIVRGRAFHFLKFVFPCWCYGVLFSNMWRFPFSVFATPWVAFWLAGSGRALKVLGMTSA